MVSDLLTIHLDSISELAPVDLSAPLDTLQYIKVFYTHTHIELLWVTGFQLCVIKVQFVTHDDFLNTKIINSNFVYIINTNFQIEMDTYLI